MNNAQRSPVVRRRFLIGLAAPIVIVALFCLFERTAGRRHLREVRHSLKSEGLLRPLAEVAPSLSAEEIANGKQFLAAIAPLQGLRDPYPAIQNGPEAMRLIAPGLAVSGVSGTAPLFSARADEKMPEDWEAFRKDVNAGGAVLAAATHWLEKPVAINYDYIGMSENSLGQSFQLSAWLQASAVLKLHDGDIQGGIDDLFSLQRLSVFTGRPNTPVHCFLENGMRITWLFPLTWEVLQTGAANDTDLARLQEIVSQRRSFENQVAAMEIEMARLPQVYPEFDDEDGWNSLREQSGFFARPLMVWLRTLLWSSIWQDGDLSGALLESSANIRNARDLATKRNWRKRIPKPISKVSEYHRWRFPFQEKQADYNAFESSLESAVRGEVSSELLIAAIALERYRLKNGAYPETLEALKPDFVKELPHDWFDGQPLRYQRLPENRFLLYSVNEDGIDNGGDPSLPRGGSPSMHSGRDLVWPQLQE